MTGQQRGCSRSFDDLRRKARQILVSHTGFLTKEARKLILELLPGYEQRAKTQTEVAHDGDERQKTRLFAPRMDLEEEVAYVVRMDIPGADDSDISVKIEDRLLTISGRIEEREEERVGSALIRNERRSGRFHRSVSLPRPVEAAEMTAEYENGVLLVRIPQAEASSRSRTIDVL